MVMRRLVSRGEFEPRRREAAFRRTRRQALGRGLYAGIVVGVAAAGLATAALADRWLGGNHGPRHSGWWLLAALGVPAAIGAVVGGAFGVRAGADADDLGLRAVPAAPRAFAAWADIVDLRTERRRRRTVVAAYLASGRVVRLRAPYDGPRLDHDPDFERKFFRLRNLWETHRNWRRRA